MTDPDRPGLFDVSAKASRRVFFPTNRHNLLKALATRTLAPLAGYADKYYDDLLRFAPGRIPLVADGINEGVASLVASAEHDFPVLVEINASMLTAVDVPALGPNGGRAVVGNDGAAAWAPAGPMPFTVVSAVHFRSQADQDAFSLNEFSDVRPIGDLLSVAPDLFGSAPTPDLQGWLEGLEPAPVGVGSDRLDRRGGALLMGISTADAIQAAVMVPLLNGSEPKASESAIDGLTDWIRGAGPVGSADRTTMWIVVDELADVDRAKVWRPGEILASVRRRLASSSVGEEDLRRAETILERTEAIVRSDVPFERFRADGWHSLQALLLILMRPEPERFEAWDFDETGAHPEVRFLGSALLGILTGRARLPVTLRPPRLDDLIAAWECSMASSVECPAPAMPSVALVEREDEVLIEAAGQPVARLLRVMSSEGHATVHTGTNESLESYAPADTGVSLVGSSDSKGNAAEVSANLIKAFAAALQAADGGSVAVEYATTAGLPDCTTTTLRADSRASRTEIDDTGVLNVTVRGFATVTHTLVVEAFLARIRAGQIPEDVLQRILNMGSAATEPLVAVSRKRRSRKQPERAET